MSLTVVGSIAFDAVETQTAKRDRLLGGAAVHFSLASSFLAETRVIGPVGDDFGDAELAKQLDVLAAETVKRVVRIPASSDAHEDALRRLEGLTELKTAWHPIGA